MDAFYLIDKPIWISSFDIIRKLRKILQIRKMWHTWTLDPLATWLVLIAVWNYTKLIPYLEKDTKEYKFKIWLDWKSKSFDLWTYVDYISENEKNKFKYKIKIEDIIKLLKNNFTWKIYQLPPKYSALKIWGKRAYNKIRAWEDFELKKREVIINNIEIINFSYPNLTLRAKVSAWTYIRSIASDLWKILWCGWYIKELRRIKIWNIGFKNINNLDNFNINNILEEKEIFNKHKFILLNDKYLKKLNNWLEIKHNFNLKINDDLFIWDNENITNIVNFDWEYLKPIRRIIV
jgi:tRNA pseudouridine55 synthase